MNNLGSFNAIYGSGGFIQNPNMVSTMSMVFNKIYIPNNYQIALDFCRNFDISVNPKLLSKMNSIEVLQYQDGNEFINDLTQQQKRLFENYIIATFVFLYNYKELLGDIIESDLVDYKSNRNIFNNNEREYNHNIHVKLDEEDRISSLLRKIGDGYYPVYEKSIYSVNIDNFTKLNSNALATLLAMKSVDMLVPQMKGCKSEIILEARSRLSDYLPLYWASMLRLSGTLKSRIENNKSNDEIIFEAEEIINTEIRPVLIEINHKIKLEKKLFFYKILNPIKDFARLIIPISTMSQHEILSGSLLLGASVAQNSVGHLSDVEKIKLNNGVAFLLEANKFLDNTTKTKKKG